MQAQSYFPPLRILMTADTVGGVWTYALELARALGRYHVEITLVTMGARMSNAQRQEAGGIPGMSVCGSDFKLEWMDNPWDDVDKAGEWLLALERDVQPNIVHLNGYAHGTLPWTTPVVMAGHSCVLSWWQAVKGEEAPDEWTEYRRRVQAGLQAADVVVAPSYAMLCSLHANYGPLRQSAMIYNGLDRTPAVRSTRDRMVFAAGRLWDEAKNIAALEDVASELDLPVVIAGPTEQHAPASQAVYTGRLSRQEMESWYERAAIYALPARYEPFGLTALEAALGGCALVLGDIPSLREVWDDAALYVDPDDRECLRRTVARIADNDAERSMYAQRARERAKRYTATTMAASYMRVYAALLRSTHPSRRLFATGISARQQSHV